MRSTTYRAGADAGARADRHDRFEGLFMSREIASPKLDADLVILSACTR
jgi:hypothetical protein